MFLPFSHRIPLMSSVQLQYLFEVNSNFSTLCFKHPSLKPCFYELNMVHVFVASQQQYDLINFSFSLHPDVSYKF